MAQHLRLFIIIVFILTKLCSSSPLVELGLVTPTATPDPFAHYRVALQPKFRDDIESLPPLPRYHITVQLDERQSRLNGVTRITIPSPDSEIVLRLYPNLSHYNGSMNISRANINQIPVTVNPLDADSTAVRLMIPPQADGSLSDMAVVDLTFSLDLGHVPDSKGSYTLFGWDGATLSLPGFYPTLAVRQAGEWVIEQPPSHGDVLFNEVALYQLDITLPQELIVVASGVTVNLINNSNQTRTWQITGGPLRDMTVVAGPFQALSETGAGATITSYYLPGNESGARDALAHATAALRLYSDRYGPYPYTELDIVDAPLNMYGMEYTGLVMIGEDLYRNQREFLRFLVAHEVAHQWWYAIVGNNPYQHPWLDEGLTEYSAFDYYRGVYGQPRAEALLTGHWYIPFDQAMQGGIDGRVDRPAREFDSTSYQLLVYAKSALFFNALRIELGDETYQQIIQTYYAENRYQIVTPKHFLAIAERVSGQDLNHLAEKWLR
ncbi:M1 family metallopeptidase [Anaerolineales bacterium HSG24]|nr:M1 family metallopeptidase [Anaerolineales bacterium HSG24]